MCFWWKAAARLWLRSSLLKIDLTEGDEAEKVFREYLGL